MRASSSFRPRFPLSLSGGQRKSDDRKTVAFDFVNADPVASAPANEYIAFRHSRFEPGLQGGQRPDSKRDDQGRHQVDHPSIPWRPFSFRSRKKLRKNFLAFKFSPGFYAYVCGGQEETERLIFTIPQNAQPEAASLAACVSAAVVLSHLPRCKIFPQPIFSFSNTGPMKTGHHRPGPSFQIIQSIYSINFSGLFRKIARLTPAWREMRMTRES